MSNQKEILQKAIFPWQSVYDENSGQYYYFNQLTGESEWQLPDDLLEKVDKILKGENQKSQEKQEQNEESINDNDQEQQQEEEEQNEQIQIGGEEVPLVQRTKFDQTEVRNMDRFLDDIVEKKRTYNENIAHLMKRPARKQQEQQTNADVAYTQGGLDYNIWYGKHLTESRDKTPVRERAKFRMDPDLDTGYTKADLNEKFASYFCFHFARGMCCEGSNCKYFHRCPNIYECQSIDGTRDIFGRNRHDQYRADMGGTGSFSQETRTLMVSDFRVPKHGEEGVKIMYEIIWRHFSIYGEIEDITIKPGKGFAFIRFTHRCFAEFAKECMMNQALDNKEMILIRWALDDDKNPLEKDRRQREERKMVQDAIEKKQREQQLRDHNEMLQKSRDELMRRRLEEEMMIKEQEDIVKQKQNQIDKNLDKMNSILEKIGDGDEEGNNDQNEEIDVNKLIK